MEKGNPSGKEELRDSSKNIQTASFDPETGITGEYPKFLHDKWNAFVLFFWIASFASSLGCLILLMVDYANLNGSGSLPESHLTASLFTFLISAIFFVFTIILFVRYSSNKPKIIRYEEDAHKIICPKCHGENKIGARVCVHCGADLISTPVASETGYPSRPYGIVLAGFFYRDYFTPVFLSVVFLTFLILAICGFTGIFALGLTIFFLSVSFIVLLIACYHFLLAPVKVASPKENKNKKHAYHYYSDHLEEVTIVKTKKGEKKIQSELYFRDALKAKKIKNYYIFIGRYENANVIFFLDETKLPAEYVSILSAQLKEIQQINGK